MHKIFAKPLFLGKKVVFLPQCHSTNDELVQLARDSEEPEGTVVYTNDQLNGKGQRGNIWFAEPGKNILMSLLLRPKFLSPTNQFYLNLIAGLAIVDTIKPLINDQVQLKWPNDVYVADRKIAGVLIESNLRGNSLETAILGIGLNINQSGFGIPTATSLALESNLQYDRDDVLESLLCNIEKWYLQLKNGSMAQVLEAYHKLLRWRGELRKFKSNDTEFDGEIIGIDSFGRLAINVNDELKTFGIKEVEFLR